MWEVPKAISPIEAVTMSMYVMPVASSSFILVDINVVMAGPTKRLGGISSSGALMVTHEGWPLIKDQQISLKPGSGTFGGSSREGLGIADLCNKVELESPCPLLLCSSIQWCWSLPPTGNVILVVLPWVIQTWGDPPHWGYQVRWVYFCPAREFTCQRLHHLLVCLQWSRWGSQLPGQHSG